MFVFSDRNAQLKLPACNRRQCRAPDFPIITLSGTENPATHTGMTNEWLGQQGLL